MNKQQDFHPLTVPVLHWIHTSIVKALDIMYYKYLHKRRTESDLLKHVWSIIDTCFYSGDIDAVSGEATSKATSNYANSSRSIAGIEACGRRKIGNKTDILFKTEILRWGLQKQEKKLTGVVLRPYMGHVTNPHRL
ncbi:hypothetical protein BJV82DRAFT_306172 [Fennellomyces sp. T-0311]|nr:hypothetical protein BJV82DRAFT_306172 [Fennellomyces sp. T-0311]